MDPLQAFQHLNQIIEQVNAILGSFIAKEVSNIKEIAKVVHDIKGEDNIKEENSQSIDELE